MTRVLIVEDHASMRESLTAALTASGDFTVVGEGIRFGLVALKGVGRAFIKGLLAERVKNGPFTDFMDFCDRMFDQDLNRRVVESLIKSGAFDKMGCRRSQLM